MAFPGSAHRPHSRSFAYDAEEVLNNVHDSSEPPRALCQIETCTILTSVFPNLIWKAGIRESRPNPDEHLLEIEVVMFRL
jgi:hypothetical protein